MSLLAEITGKPASEASAAVNNLSAKDRREYEAARERLQDQVTLGAEFLDDNYEAWADGIDLAKLRIESGCCCILGQLDGSYGEGRDRNELPNGQLAGFYAHSALDYAVMNTLWAEEVQRRVNL